MINKISFKNYKAFVEGTIKIRPITILLGANSVGKSSIMQLFLMLQQTALSELNYKSALKLHGGFVSMGEGVNLIRKKDNSKILSISIDFYNVDILKELRDEYFIRYCEEVIYFASLIQKYLGKSSSQQLNLFQKIKTAFKTEDELDFRFMRMNPNKIEEVLDRKTFCEIINSIYKKVEKLNINDLPKILKEDIYYHNYHVLDPYFYSRSRGARNHLKIFKENKDEYILTYDFLQGLKNDLSKGHFLVNYDIAVVEKNLILKKLGIFNGANEIVSIEFDLQSSIDFKPSSITSKYLNKENFPDKTFLSLKEVFVNPRTIFSFINETRDSDNEELRNCIFANIIKNILSSFNSIVSRYFQSDTINYVSPLRAHPKRYYFLDKAKINAYVDTLDGDAIAETLKDNSLLRNQVNSWLEKFNLKVEVSQLQDIIHKLVVNQNSLSLDITDVGFGISQVLPVIIQGFLSHETSLTLIEQPEIHLHPKMQADLADLFIDIVQPSKYKKKDSRSLKYLLIETHSEYLLKRLRRRISDGTISSDKVAIYLIDPQTENQGASIKELIVKEKGQFEWPTEFYGGEILKDTTEFIKNQQK